MHCAAQERIPEAGSIDNFGGPGPPYALLQGSLPPVPGGWKAVAVESAPFVQRGMVCLIGGGPDFFIAVGPHHEWGHAHTVWGQAIPPPHTAPSHLTHRVTHAGG